MIIVDYSGVAISNLFTMKMDPQENLVRHMILNSIRMYNVKYRDEYGQMVIACDGGGTWRRQMYPQYKANRKKNREEGGLDWHEFFRILDSVREEIKANLPYKTVHIQGVEADDVIATLVESTQEFGRGEPVMIISADKDFIQLHRHSNVKQFSPQTKTLVREKDPVAYLQEHVLRGDGGDGVPNVLSPDDVFVSGGRQKPLSSKKLAEWIKNWDNLERVMTPEEYRNFCRNRNLIDFDRIPQEKKDEIMRVYESVQPHSNILNYLISKRCTQLIGCAEEFKSHERNAHL
jgi:hypothetical protein